MGRVEYLDRYKESKRSERLGTKYTSALKTLVT
jgi:hypothetical protein